MDTSHFSSSQKTGMHLEKICTNGSTCDTFRCKMYGKLIFVKKLKPQYASDIRYREALQKEFETGFRLEHPNLARYISLNEEEMHIEYIDGVTLSEKLANDQDYFSKRANSDKFITQLLSAVQYLHENQVLHLDIKPDNIMLTRINNDVKLIDLGFSHTDCYTDTSGHTELYCSPEQIDGSGTDERSDIYTIGRMIDLLPNRHIYRKIIARCTKHKKEDRYQKIEHIKLPRPTDKAAIAIAATAIAIAILAFSAFYMTGTVANKHIAQTETSSPNNAGNTPKAPRTESTSHAANDLNEIIKGTVANKHIAQTETSSPNNAGNTPKAPRTESASHAANDLNEIIKKSEELQKRTTEEFEIFKVKINGYLKNVITFANDSNNLQRYPSYYEYGRKYKELWRESLREIEKDTFTYNRYKSNSNPYSKYVNGLRDSIEHKYNRNCSILP